MPDREREERVFRDGLLPPATPAADEEQEAQQETTSDQGRQEGDEAMIPETEESAVDSEMAGDNDVDMKHLGKEEFPLSYLLEESPVQRLLAFAETVRRDPRKVRQCGLTAKEILTDRKVSAIIRDLPPASLQELADEVTELKQEAEKFGFDSRKMERGIQQELKNSMWW